MPKYDYRCTLCGENFEATSTVEDRESSQCPKCGAQAKKIITNPLHVKTYGIGYHKKDTGDFA